MHKSTLSVSYILLYRELTMPFNSLDEFNKERLEALFRRIGEKLHQQNLIADITLYGGSALMLRYGFRESAHDVDVVMDQWDEAALRTIASEIALEENLNTHWFNDDVKHVIGEREQTDLYMVFPDKNRPALRIHTPKPEYMLALQVRAMERTEVSGDAAAPLGKLALDVKRLAASLGFNKAQTLDCTKFFFPNKKFPAVVLKWLDITFSNSMADRSICRI
jgi:hypothetical protein